MFSAVKNAEVWRTHLRVLVHLRTFRQQVLQVVLLLVAVALEDHHASVPVVVHGGDGGRVDQPVFCPAGAARVPHLPLGQQTKGGLLRPPEAAA